MQDTTCTVTPHHFIFKGVASKSGTEATSEDRVKEKPGEGAAAECQYALLEFEKPVTCQLSHLCHT